MSRKIIPKIAYPTIALVISCFGLFALNFALAAHGLVPLYVNMALTVVCLYSVFTPLHDSVHDAIFIRVKKPLRRLNKLLGIGAGIILLAPFPAFAYIHLTHHKYVNNPNQDPDFWVCGKSPIGSFFRMVTIPLQYYRFFLCSNDFSVWDKIKTIVFYNGLSACLAFLLTQFVSLADVFYIWIIPAFFTHGLLALVFDFIPHHPHDDPSRYNNATTFKSKILSILMLNQTHHVLHHMYPLFPFYLYQKAFEGLREEEKQKHTRIIRLPF